MSLLKNEEGLLSEFDDIAAKDMLYSIYRRDVIKDVHIENRKIIVMGSLISNPGVDSLVIPGYTIDTVVGNVVINSCKQKTLEGAPRLVGGYMYVTGHDNITSLKGCPEYIGKLLLIDLPNLRSLKGIAKKVEYGVYMSNVGVRSLEGLPDTIAELQVYECDNITDFRGCAQNVKSLQCSGCRKLSSLNGLPGYINKVNIENCRNLKSLQGTLKEVDEIICRNCGVKTLDDNIKIIYNRIRIN